MREIHRRPLFRHVPGLEDVVRPMDLAELPTPIREEPALAKRWGLTELHIKCDDLSSPVYGGSKLRNLEYFLGRARAQGATGVATMGPYGSHQVLATAVYGKRAGFRTRAVLTPQPDVREGALNERLLPALDMEILRCNGFAAVPWAYLGARLRPLGGKRPYWIPPGSADPLGVLGVIDGAFEVAEAVQKGELPMPDDVIVPTGTCATAAGLYLGFAMAGLPVRVVAVRVVPLVITGVHKLKRMARRTLKILRNSGYRQAVPWGELLWVDDYAAPGYGLASEEAQATMAEVAELGSFRTDVTYTGKSLALLRAGKLAGRRVLFWNTFSATDPDPAQI
jgi:D-cysteine desulfhydrase